MPIHKVSKKFSFLKPIKNSKLIRLGRNADGGYLVDSNIIKNCGDLVTFGLGNDWSFELDFMKINKNSNIYVYDHTVNSWQYLSEIFKHIRRLILFRVTVSKFMKSVNSLKKFLNFINATNVHFIKKKISKIATNKNEIDIKTVFLKTKNKKDLILKCDIEGSEYEIVDQIIKYNKNLKMILFEFHWINKNQKKFINSVKKLKKYFNIVHVHGNNHSDKTIFGLPIILELTLINKKLSKKHVKYNNKFPLKKLDYPNNPYKKDISFKF